MNNEITYEEEELICFEDGLFGFEAYKKYLPLPIDEDSDATLCIQSVEDSELSFIVMNPFMLMEEYNPVLSKKDMERVGAMEEESLSFYVICIIRDTADESSVNLKSPIVVNTVTRKACQVILESEEYHFSHPLREFVKRGGNVC